MDSVVGLRAPGESALANECSGYDSLVTMKALERPEAAASDCCRLKVLTAMMVLACGNGVCTSTWYLTSRAILNTLTLRFKAIQNYERAECLQFRHMRTTISVVIWRIILPIPTTQLTLFRPSFSDANTANQQVHIPLADPAPMERP